MPDNEPIFEEVVSIVLDYRKAISQAKQASEEIRNAIQSAGEVIQLGQGEVRGLLNLKRQAELNVIAEVNAAKLASFEEEFRVRMGISKKVAQAEKAALREEYDIQRELHRYRLEGVKEENLVEKAAVRQELEEAKALYRYRLGAVKEEEVKRLNVEKEELTIAKALHQYRLEAAREEESKRLSLEKEELTVAKALHQYRLQAAKEEAEEQHKNNQPGFFGKAMQAGNVLRSGAAVAGAAGNFQLAAGIYGLERVAQTAGLAEVSLLKLPPAFLGAAAAAAAFAAPIFAMIHGNEFNEALHDMGTLLNEVADHDLDKFNAKLSEIGNSAVKVSTQFNTNLIEVVKGFKTALSSGIDEKDLEKFSRTVGSVSVALGSSFDDTTNILTSFKDAYGLTIDQMSLVGDKLFRLVDVGKVNVKELLTSFGRLIPVASNAGVSITDAMAGVAALSRSGMTTSQSVTALSQFIAKLQNPSEKAKKEMTELGISFGKAAFAGRDLGEVVGEIAGKISGKEDLLAELFPEERAKRGAAGMMKLLDLVKDSIKQLNEAQGAAADATLVRMDTFSQKTGQIGKAFSGVMAEVGRDLLDVANKVFFGSGGFSEEKLLRIQIKFEEIGQVITGLGSMLIFAAKEIATLFDSTAGSLYRSLKSLVQGDVWGALKEQVGAFDSLTMGTADNATKAWDGYTTAIRASKDRIADLNTEMQNLSTRGVKRLGDAGNEVSHVFESIADSVRNASEELSKSQEKLFEKRVKDKARDEEKTKLEGYADEISKLQEILALKTHIAEVKALSATEGVALNNSSDEKAAVYRKILPGFVKDETEGLKEQIALIKDKRKLLEKEIDTRTVLEAERKRIEKDSDAAFAEWEKLDAKVREYNKSVLTKAKEIYKADEAAYKKVQDDKLSYLKNIHRAMESAATKNASIMERLQKLKNENDLANADGPDRKRRLAEKQMAAAKEKIERASTSEEAGKIFDSEFLPAAEARRGVNSDTKRGAKNFDADVDSIMALLAAVGQREQATGQKALDSANKQNPNRPDFKVAAEEAAKSKEVALKFSVSEQPELKVRITSDGKGIQFLADAVKAQIEAEEKNQTGNPKFPKGKFSTATRPVDDGLDE